jgi:hypothetical protein
MAKVNSYDGPIDRKDSVILSIAKDLGSEWGTILFDSQMLRLRLSMTNLCEGIQRRSTTRCWMDSCVWSERKVQ